jgi:hypothetical protein
MHGFDESQALTVAAQELSQALANQRTAATGTTSEWHRNNASAWVEVARANYERCYLAYTNPFGANKHAH